MTPVLSYTTPNQEEKIHERIPLFHKICPVHTIALCVAEGNKFVLFCLNFFSPGEEIHRCDKKRLYCLATELLYNVNRLSMSPPLYY